MNKLSIITAFLGLTRNRYMTYQPNRSLAEKLAMAAQVQGAEGVELCYPTDFEDPKELAALLKKHNLGVSGVNFRSRRDGKWWRGSFISEYSSERNEVVEDLKRAMDAAAELKCDRVTTCPLNEGADTPFEMDYLRAYDHAATTLGAACAHNREMRICLEYKISDPMARCLVGSAAETAAFCQLVGADNLGATLDIGHAILSGERPAQSAALLAKANRLFYVHLNDNDGKWDWDMLPGAYHLWETVEMLYTLRKIGYDNDWYAFDIFSKELDQVENYTAAMTLTRKLEEITDRINPELMETFLREKNASKTIPYLYSLL